MPYSTASLTTSNKRLGAFSPEVGDLDYKEVYYPDPGSDEAVILLAQTAFEEAGYVVKRAEKAIYHPVFAFRMKTPPGPPPFVRQRDLQAQLRQLLSLVGLDLPKDAPLVERNGERLLVTFIWQPDTKQGGKRRIRRVPVGA